jgi:hypothetical protein
MEYRVVAEMAEPGGSTLKEWHMVRLHADVAMCGRELDMSEKSLPSDAWAQSGPGRSATPAAHCSCARLPEGRSTAVAGLLLRGFVRDSRSSCCTSAMRPFGAGAHVHGPSSRTDHGRGTW